MPRTDTLFRERVLAAVGRIPFERVANARGYVPNQGRWWGALEQIAHLRDEGIEVDDQGNLDLEEFQWGDVPASAHRS